jgi:hypothetical protein
MSGSLQRDLVCRLAPTDSVRALAAARAITDPWYACQALAWVARFARESEFSRIIQESLRVVRDEADAYRVVAASAWPIRAIVERNHLEMLPSIVPDLLRRAEDIEILASRSEALFLIFQAIFPAGSKHWRPVLESLRRASTQLMSWRQRRNLLDAIMIVRGEDEKLALEITNSIDDQKLKGKIERIWAASEPRLPRRFFWTTDK